MTEYDEIPPGTLYIHILILKTRAHGGEVHGFEIASSIQQATEEVPQVEEGSLYPALHRLEERGWLKADWRDTETGREAKFYTLTRAGQKRLERERSDWERLAKAIALVLKTAE